VGTEHILLALLDDPESPAASALAAVGITRAQVRLAVVRMMGTGVEKPSDEELVLTGRAEDVLELARREAAEAGQDRAGPEHILLALAQGRDGAAARILLQLDADPASIRSALPS
jgi:ATP-dependent Clp protease ATP-binding subunit ClpC